MRRRLTPAALVAGGILLGILLVAAVGLEWWPRGEARPPWVTPVALVLRLYLVVAVALTFVAAWIRRRVGVGALRRAFWWLRLWHGWILLMVGLGAALGALVFPLGAFVFGVDLPLLDILRAGVRDGGFYFFIWAPGAGFVLCVMEAHDQGKKST